MKKLLHYIKVLVTITAVCWATHAAAVLPCGDLKCRITEIVVTTADGTHDYTSSQLQENPVIKMPYDRNSIKFVFLGETEDDNCRNAIEYSTKLDNYNESWTSWSNLREADFVNLRDGAYEFRVRAKYSDEIITDIASYKFIVKTPFYRSVTAYILYSIGLIATTTIPAD